jgi:hypothetical protein
MLHLVETSGSLREWYYSKIVPIVLRNDRCLCEACH